MTYHNIDPGLARLIGRSLDAEMEDHIKLWKEHLAAGRVNEEMRTVFSALGWLSSQRDPRLRLAPDAPDGAGSITRDPSLDNGSPVEVNISE